jgi:shikimate dehydrogenase
MPASAVASPRVYTRVANTIAMYNAHLTDSVNAVKVGLVGAGIQASRSPALHEVEGRALGLDYSYALIDQDQIGFTPSDLPEVIAAARDQGLSGFNVTHPCKQAIIPYLDELSDDAASLGAVNAVVIQDGRAIGHNTDWYGFAEGFKRNMAGSRLEHVLLFGAGGAGAAVAHALMKLGTKTLHIADTDGARRDGLCAALNAHFGTGTCVPVLDVASDVAIADGIINATPIGMAKYPGAPLALSLLRSDLWVADIIYFPLETELLRVAKTLGCQTMNGGGMVVYQAGRGIELFSGKSPDVKRMLAHFAAME